jgi:hypothetical protein
MKANPGKIIAAPVNYAKHLRGRLHASGMNERQLHADAFYGASDSGVSSGAG